MAAHGTAWAAPRRELAARAAVINEPVLEEAELHRQAQQLAAQEQPAGWTRIASSGSAIVAFRAQGELYYKEFLPRSRFEGLKAVLRGSRATRARSNSEALLAAGFEAPANLAWGKLSGGREYLITSTVKGQGVSEWLQTLNAVPVSAESRALRWQLLSELGSYIGRLHATGFTHGDLRTSNVFGDYRDASFSFALIDNERTIRRMPAPRKLLLKNLMQLNMHPLSDLSGTDRMRFFRAWKCQMNGLSTPQARLLATEAYQWAMRRMAAKNTP